MARAADQARWLRTFALLAQVYNANRPEGADAIEPLAFYMWGENRPTGPAPPPTEADRAELRQIFPKRTGPQKAATPTNKRGHHGKRKPV